VIRLNRRAFTLIELLIALTIGALLTAAAAWSFARPLHRARAAEAVAQLKYLDASTRDLARRLGRESVIAFDVSEGTMERRSRRAGNEATFRAAVASPIAIEEVRTPGRRSDHGEAVIAVSPLGLSDTYAVKLAGPEGRQWVVFTGLAGEAITLTNDAELNAIFARVASPPTARRDAD
jgi:prepilin-type N-terminal cleavage/methylation domain-containing protein